MPSIRSRLAACVSGETSHACATDSADAPAPQMHDGHGVAYLQDTARDRESVFVALMEAVKTHWFGQISDALYDVGAQAEYVISATRGANV